MIAAIALAATAASSANCMLPAGWDAIMARHTRYIVFGEIHGSAQSPALVGDVACALAAKGERVLVGIEQRSDDDAALQVAWTLPDSRFKTDILKLGWAGRDDGVTSRAMYDLVLRLHHLKQLGRAISLVAFNGSQQQEQQPAFASLPGQGPHEAAQADNIRVATSRGRYDHVLVLVGNVHARKEPIAHGNMTFEPMAMRLAATAGVTSLNMRYGSGAMWNCQLKPGYSFTSGKSLPADAIDCSSHPISKPDLDFPVPSVGLGAPDKGEPDTAYDGYYWLGKVTASPPMLPVSKK